MSERLRVRLALPVLLAWTASIGWARAADDAASLNTFEKPGDQSYFALSVTPNVELPTPENFQVVVLFDTSASQTGVFRDKAIETLSAVLQRLKANTQVKLLVCDLDTHALTDTFVAADSPEMAKAIDTLKRRAPLGATDMVSALSAAANSFSGKSTGERAVVYIGDGQSGANFIDSKTLKQVVNQLVEKQVAVTSYAIGPRADNALLAALANQTGGLFAIDGDVATVKQVATFLANAVEGVVIWPTKATLPVNFGVAYPKPFPPLRTDRDSIVIGTLKSSVKTIPVSLAATACGKPVSMNWNLSPRASNEDYSFLPDLVSSAKANDGAGLATVGTVGLLETRRVINAAVEQLAKLGSQAVATGNIDAAERLTSEALRRDPNDPTARTVKKAIEKQRSLKSAQVPAAAAKDASPAGVSARKTSKGILKLEKFRNDQAVPPAPEFPQEETGPEGGYLEDIGQQNRVISEMIQREVENAVAAARDRMGVNPDGVIQDLKLELDKVMRAPEVTAEVRAQLRDQIETTLKEAGRRATERIEIDQQAQAAISARKERVRIVQALDRDQEKMKQLMDRYDALMDEGRYALAEETAYEVAEIKPDLPVAISAVLNSRMTRYHEQSQELRVLRQRGVVDTLYQVELAHIPFPDDEPIIYPSAPVWEELTQRRKKYASVDLKKVGPAEERISKALDETTSMEFVETPLSDVVDYLKDLHKIEIQLDTRALEDAGAGSDTPITKNLKGISLRSALRLLLGGLDLTYVIKDEVLLITTPEKAGSELVTKVYPVADLVLPIQQTGFAGGFGGLGGGMGGGGMMGAGGGGGGQFGGMGGGGGGMGGFGGGGMGGGGGGGFFSVPDDATSEPAKGGLQAFAVKDDLKLKSTAPIPAPTSKAAEKLKAKTKPVAIELKIAPDADSKAAWYEYFQTHEDVTNAQVRETARTLMKARNHSGTIALIEGALATGHAQPWMYEALGLAMILSGSDKAEIERALMSAVDFAESADDLMYAAQYMARNGLEKRALSIFRQVSAADPLRPEPLQYGLQLSTRVNDLDGQKWSSVGVLKQAWPNDKKELRDQANRVALAVLEQLKAENRTKEADEFQTQLADALVRDVLVKVTWTGDADVDVLIEEPSGTVCSFRNPRTTAGGVMLGDTASRGMASKDGYSEVYICPEAFSGTYKMHLRRVWGKVTAGKVTVDLYTNYGTKQMQHERQQIPLGEQDAVVLFDVFRGRRNEAVAQHLVANAAANQLEVNRAILAQQLNNVANNNANANFALSRAALEGQFPIVRSGVGFQPVIITLPSGANFTCTGVISADRRYVRITVLPLFSQIGQVTTFNIANGNTTTNPPPAGTGGQGGSGIGTPPVNGGNAGGGAAGAGANNPGGDNAAGNP